jgi:hypothetical protein
MQDVTKYERTGNPEKKTNLHEALNMVCMFVVSVVLLKPFKLFSERKILIPDARSEMIAARSSRLLGGLEPVLAW